MFLTSEWLITFDPNGTPRNLVNYDDLISEELNQQLTIGFQAVPIVDADPFLQSDGSAIYNFTFTVYNVKTLEVDAREFIMDSMIASWNLDRKPLRIRVRGLAAARGKSDIYWEYANCRIRTFTPFRQLDHPDACAARTYSVSATGLTKTIVP